jgi:hypothetical protein
MEGAGDHDLAVAEGSVGGQSGDGTECLAGGGDHAVGHGQGGQGAVVVFAIGGAAVVLRAFLARGMIPDVLPMGARVGVLDCAVLGAQAVLLDRVVDDGADLPPQQQQDRGAGQPGAEWSAAAAHRGNVARNNSAPQG